MKKDKNGNEIGKGIIKKYNLYFKVHIVNDEQIVVSGGFETLKRAREQTCFYEMWTKEAEQINGIEQIEYESLGVFDSKKKEYKVGDTIDFGGTEYKIIGATKSSINDKTDYIHFFDSACGGGWNYTKSKNCIILHSALEKPIKEKSKEDNILNFTELKNAVKRLGKIVDEL